MPVNKGFLSIVENEPNFSNQALENAVNDIKAVDKDDGHQFILSQFLLDTAIRNNPVLTTSQKNDVLETIYAAQPHLQIGRILTDVVRHTASIIDATIVPVPADETQTETFLGILQNVQAMQSLIPELYGVPAKDKGRAVNDHLGTLNNIFLTTEYSSAPVFTRLKRIMELIDANSRVTSALNLAVTNAATANLNLRTFLTTITDDSTDFQETLDNRVNSIVSMFSTLNTRIAQIPGDPTTDLVAIKDEITDQVSLENRNLADLSTTIDTLSDNLSYSSLAEDDTLRGLMSTVAQNKQWQTYFENYENEKDNLNPIYTTDTDSDKSSVIDQVLAGKGLPDVLDSTDLDAVAAKARRDTRIDTAFFDSYTSEQQIIKSCEQLGITTQYRNINSLSGTLLTNMNQHDRDTVANELDQNQSADTLS